VKKTWTLTVSHTQAKQRGLANRSAVFTAATRATPLAETAARPPWLLVFPKHQCSWRAVKKVSNCRVFACEFLSELLLLIVAEFLEMKQDEKPPHKMLVKPTCKAVYAYSWSP
jgi:hypothetical protein